MSEILSSSSWFFFFFGGGGGNGKRETPINLHRDTHFPRSTGPPIVLDHWPLLVVAPRQLVFPERLRAGLLSVPDHRLAAALLAGAALRANHGAVRRPPDHHLPRLRLGHLRSVPPKACYRDRTLKGLTQLWKSRRIYPKYMPKCSVGSTDHVCKFLLKKFA